MSGSGRVPLRGAYLLAALLVALVAAAITGLLYWSTRSADALALERQNQLVHNVLANSASRIAHDQRIRHCLG